MKDTFANDPDRCSVASARKATKVTSASRALATIQCTVRIAPKERLQL